MCDPFDLPVRSDIKNSGREANRKLLYSFVCYFFFLPTIIESFSNCISDFQVCETIRSLVKNNIRSACTNDTLLHLCVSRLNMIKSGYFNDGTATRVICLLQLKHH